MELFEAIRGRHSVRKFKNIPVEREKLDAILEAAVNAPSGMNRQTWNFTVVTNENWLKRLDERINDIIGESARTVNTERNGKKGFSCRYHAPVLVIVSASAEVPTSEADCACALENIFLSSYALGLGSCWINQLGKANCEKVRDLADEAGVPSKNMIYGCAAIGYEEGTTVKPPRKENVVKYFP